MNFYEIIEKNRFYLNFSRFVENWYFKKGLTKQSLNHVIFEKDDLISEVYVEMINDYKNNSEKYKSRSEEELLRWFCQTAKFKLGDDNRKRYSKNLSTDRTLSVDEKRILRGRLPRADEEKIKFGDLDETQKKVIMKKLDIQFSNINNNAFELDNISNELEKVGSSSNKELFRFKNYEDFFDTRQKVAKIFASKKISEKCKELFKLVINEFSYKDIASILNLKINSIKSRLSNCRLEAAKVMG